MGKTDAIKPSFIQIRVYLVPVGKKTPRDVRQLTEKMDQLLRAIKKSPKKVPKSPKNVTKDWLQFDTLN
jgi:hypothetical protein